MVLLDLELTHLQLEPRQITELCIELALRKFFLMPHSAAMRAALTCPLAALFLKEPQDAEASMCRTPAVLMSPVNLRCILPQNPPPVT